MDLLLRRDFEAAALVRAHPPVIDDPHKRMCFELAGGAEVSGRIDVTRWRATTPDAPRGTTVDDSGALEVLAEPTPFAYDDTPGVWHVNFADPALFFGYGTALLAQDELQCLEHPAIGSLREALHAVGHARTADREGATPVLVAGLERRCELDTLPAPGRPHGLYGNEFADAPAATVRAALRLVKPPTRSNLIAMAAPAYGQGTYRRAQLDAIFATAYTGFAAAVVETQRLWPGAPTEVRTGFWGCGAFGGNRTVMVALQLIAARRAGVSRVRFYTVRPDGLADFERGTAAAAQPIDALLATLERERWGTSNGT